MKIRLAVTQDDFDANAEIEALSAGQSVSGAIVSFIGLVRGASDAVLAMTLEHYPGMTEKQIALLIEEASSRWALDAVTVLHRVGRLEAGARIVFVGVAGRHRGEAFAACEFVIDGLKTRAPFWKLEETAEGERWVAARESDEERTRRW